MSITTLTQIYNCGQDCDMSGCCGHEVKLSYQSISDAYTFMGRHGRFHLDRGELAALVVMLRELHALNLCAINPDNITHRDGIES